MFAVSLTCLADILTSAFGGEVSADCLCRRLVSVNWLFLFLKCLFFFLF